MPTQSIHPTAIIYPHVQLPQNITVGPYCIIGEPFSGGSEEELTTIIGEGAVIRSHSIIYAGNKIGENFMTGHHVVIREKNDIGNNISIGTMSCIEHHIILEDGVRIHSQAFIPEFSHLKSQAWIGPNVVLTNARYPKSKNVKAQLTGCILNENVKIGANSTLLPGVEIGKNALIGAGSVVTKRISPDDVAVGNPARVISNIKSITEYEQ